MTFDSDVPKISDIDLVNEGQITLDQADPDFIINPDLEESSEPTDLPTF